MGGARNSGSRNFIDIRKYRPTVYCNALKTRILRIIAHLMMTGIVSGYHDYTIIPLVSITTLNILKYWLPFYGSKVN